MGRHRLPHASPPDQGLQGCRYIGLTHQGFAHQHGVGAELLKSSLPVSRAAKLRSREGDAAKPAALAALTDGEDFELLFTVASKDAVKLLDAWKKKFPETKLTCVGKIVKGEGISLRDQMGARKLSAHGYVHFS